VTEDSIAAEDKFEVNSFIKGIYLKMINIGLGKREKTVKCISDELFSCLPRNERIKASMDKGLIKYLGIRESDLESMPDCILL
jgi:hypothetical protein